MSQIFIIEDEPWNTLWDPWQVLQKVITYWWKKSQHTHCLHSDMMRPGNHWNKRVLLNNWGSLSTILKSEEFLLAWNLRPHDLERNILMVEKPLILNGGNYVTWLLLISGYFSHSKLWYTVVKVKHNKFALKRCPILLSNGKWKIPAEIA